MKLPPDIWHIERPEDIKASYFRSLSSFLGTLISWLKGQPDELFEKYMDDLLIAEEYLRNLKNYVQEKGYKRFEEDLLARASNRLTSMMSGLKSTIKQKNPWMKPEIVDVIDEAKTSLMALKRKYDRM